MDWSSFPSDLVAGLVGTIAGIVLGLRIDHWREAKKVRLRDIQSLQGLVDRLAGKRAFSADRVSAGKIDADDRDRCTRSVLDARRRIISIYERLETQTELVPILQEMESDCIAYLNFIESRPDDYVAALNGLAGQLASREQQLKDLVPALVIAPPGSRDTAAPSWLPAQRLPRRERVGSADGNRTDFGTSAWLLLGLSSPVCGTSTDFMPPRSIGGSRVARCAPPYLDHSHQPDIHF